MRDQEEMLTTIDFMLLRFLFGYRDAARNGFNAPLLDYSQDKFRVSYC